jgi:hypothetical protein
VKNPKRMITVVAQKENGEQNFQSIVINKDDICITLDEKECEMLLETLKGNRGVLAITKKDEYQAQKLTLFSCEKRMSLVSYEDEEESS